MVPSNELIKGWKLKINIEIKDRVNKIDAGIGEKANFVLGQIGCLR